MKLGNLGFTLMEVLVVVMIIGILAAIAVPNYIMALEESQEKACRANIEVLTTQVERYRLATGSYPEPKEQNLVDYLVETRYLIKRVECPLGGVYSLVADKVVCSTCDAEEN